LGRQRGADGRERRCHIREREEGEMRVRVELTAAAFGACDDAVCRSQL
jgi:hypothetical protein